MAVGAGNSQSGTGDTQLDKYALPARIGLAIVGVLLCIAALVLVFFQRTTSVVTEVQTPSTPAVTMSPSPSPSPAASPSDSTTSVPNTGGADPTKTTTTVQPGSDALVLGVLGVGALLLLGAGFFERITKITLPGGAGFEMASVLSAPSAAAMEQVIAATPLEEIGPTPEARATRAAAATNLVLARATRAGTAGQAVACTSVLRCHRARCSAR